MSGADNNNEKKKLFFTPARLLRALMVNGKKIMEGNGIIADRRSFYNMYCSILY